MTLYLLALLIFPVAFVAGAYLGGDLPLEPRPQVVIPDEQAEVDAEFRRALAVLDDSPHFPAPRR